MVSGHASVETVPVIGYFLVLKSDRDYEAIADEAKYPPAIILFHSMFRAASRVFGIDVWKSGFFCETTPLYNLWTSSYGQRSVLAQFVPNGKNKVEPEEYGIFADDNPLDPAFPYYNEEADNELARHCENYDPIERLQLFFPEFEVSGVHRKLADSFNRTPRRPAGILPDKVPSPGPLHESVTCEALAVHDNGATANTRHSQSSFPSSHEVKSDVSKCSDVVSPTDAVTERSEDVVLLVQDEDHATVSLAISLSPSILLRIVTIRRTHPKKWGKVTIREQVELWTRWKSIRKRLRTSAPRRQGNRPWPWLMRRKRACTQINSDIPSHYSKYLRTESIK